MSEQVIVPCDEEVLHNDDMPDTALEVAGSKCWEGQIPAAHERAGNKIN